MWQYLPIKHAHSSVDGNSYIAVGLQIQSITAGTSLDVEFIPDISCDFDSVKKLAERCTQGQLDPIHIWDVIEDTL